MTGRTPKYGEKTRVVRIPVTICLKKLDAWIKRQMKEIKK